MANTDLTQVGAIIGSPARIPHRGFENGGLISHHLFVIRPTARVMPHAFLFHLFADDRFRMYARGHASGTTVLGFRTADCSAYEFVSPPEDLLARFGRLCDTVDRLADSLRDETEVAVLSRNLLLPRLISGEIDVEGLHIEVPKAAA